MPKVAIARRNGKYVIKKRENEDDSVDTSGMDAFLSGQQDVRDAQTRQWKVAQGSKFYDMTFDLTDNALHVILEPGPIDEVLEVDRAEHDDGIYHVGVAYHGDGLPIVRTVTFYDRLKSDALIGWIEDSIEKVMDAHEFDEDYYKGGPQEGEDG